MWNPSAMTSLCRATSPSSASAGGQEEHPCEVNNSTTVGRVSAPAGEAVRAKPRTNGITENTTRWNVIAILPARSDRTAQYVGRRPEPRRSHLRAGPDAGETPAVRLAGLLDESGDQAGD